MNQSTSLEDIINSLNVLKQKQRVGILLDENQVTDIYFQETLNLAELDKYEVDYLSVNKIYNLRTDLYDFFITERNEKTPDIYVEFHIWNRAINPGGYLLDVVTSAEKHLNLSRLFLPGYQLFDLNMKQELINKIRIYRKNVE
jgi:hypothetical protein